MLAWINVLFLSLLFGEMHCIWLGNEILVLNNRDIRFNQVYSCTLIRVLHDITTSKPLVLMAEYISN
jgi:hypothetical protein